jgi:hypothetical protein
MLRIQKLLAALTFALFVIFAVCAGQNKKTAASASMLAGLFVGLCACGMPSADERASVQHAPEPERKNSFN